MCSSGVVGACPVVDDESSAEEKCKNVTMFNALHEGLSPPRPVVSW